MRQELNRKLGELGLPLPILNQMNLVQNEMSLSSYVFDLGSLAECRSFDSRSE
jgi:hypothetical protein